MSGKVIRRTHDRKHEPSTYEEAEKIAQRALDRRRSYAIINDEVCELVQWSNACAGCHNSEDGHCTSGCKGREHRGIGCSDCGYTGRKRHGYWVPLTQLFEPEAAAV